MIFCGFTDTLKAVKSYPGKGMRRFIKASIITVIAVVITGCVINVTPGNLIYQSTKTEKLNLTRFQEQAFKDDMSVALKAVSLTSEQGHTLRGIQALYHGAKANILLFGGNGMTINQSANIVHRFGAIPANVIWFDYPGAGISDKPAKLDPEAMMADALALYDFAAEKLRNDKPFIVHGIELGTAVAANIALQRCPDALVLEKPIVNLSQLINDNSPGWSGWFTRIKLSPKLAAVDNAYQVGSYQGPLLILVGEKDLTTPPKYSQILYRVSPSDNKNLVVVEGVGHDKLMRSPIAVDAYKTFVAGL
ncbi:alpha/beta hydrolase [Alteromonas sp. ZYF713]|nr:alpha/beta hydrolase [Alteromonas sp. ZYF713]